MNREKLNRLQQEHGEIVTQALKITELCEAEKRGPTEEERERHKSLLETADGLRAEADDIREWIKEQEKVAAQQAWRDEVQRVVLPEPVAANAPDPGSTPRTQAEGAVTATPEYAAAFEAYIRRGARVPTLAGGYADGIQTAADGPMQTDVDSAGGYLIPDRISDELVQEADRAMIGMNIVRSQTLGFGEGISYPYTKERLGRAQRAGETGGTPPAGRPDIQTIDLRPTLIWYETSATIQMLMSQHFDSENYLRKELLYTLMYRCEEDIWTGKGGISSLGVMTPSDAGISTDRDRNTGKAAGIAFSGIYDAHYKDLRPPYWMMAKWYFHPANIGELRKLTDMDGQFLWQPSVQMGAPDRLDGIPVEFSEFIASALTDGTYIGLLGDMMYYRRAEYPSISIQRLVELGAKQNEVQFLGRKWDDGGVVLEESFVRLKVGA